MKCISSWDRHLRIHAIYIIVLCTARSSIKRSTICCQNLFWLEILLIKRTSENLNKVLDSLIRSNIQPLKTKIKLTSNFLNCQEWNFISICWINLKSCCLYKYFLLCQGEARGRDLCIHVINGAYTREGIIAGHCPSQYVLNCDICQLSISNKNIYFYSVTLSQSGFNLQCLSNHITFCGQFSLSLPEEAFCF